MSDEEFQLLLDYNALIYKKAAEKILSGRFAINPYTEDGRSIAPYVQQYQSITGFEANYHLGQARLLDKVAKSNDKETWFNKIREELER